MSDYRHADYRHADYRRAEHLADSSTAIRLWYKNFVFVNIIWGLDIFPINPLGCAISSIKSINANIVSRFWFVIRKDFGKNIKDA